MKKSILTALTAIGLTFGEACCSDEAYPCPFPGGDATKQESSS